jgi:hypothetical protein
MACPNFKNGPKTGLRPIGVKKEVCFVHKILGFYFFSLFLFVHGFP